MKQMQPIQRTAASPYPDTESLLAVLESLFRRSGTASVLNRRPIVPPMTFPTEIVTFRLDQKRALKLFCKYEAGRNHNAFGHRGGLEYEAEVYRLVLAPLKSTTPKSFGARKSPAGDDTWLVLEYVEDGKLLRDLHLDVNRQPQPTEMGLAAQWIGKFHAANQARVATGRLSFLNRYDCGYYAGWARRTCEFAGKLHRQFPALARICQQADELFAPLLAAQPTVIHGEYYQNNILLRERTVCPTDWESTAIAPGEIDLAALTEGAWAAELVRQCEEEYQRARWPEGAPDTFRAALAAARLYLHFRWLGEQPAWTTHVNSRWRFQALIAAAKRLRLA
jgi:aminoglycoside phosphotransferase (APT) family kinase protein